MKNKIILFMMLLFAGSILTNNVAVAQKGKKYAEIKIQTSAQCGMCKDAIEKGLAYEKGVKSSDLNLDDKVVTVVYNTKKTDADKIRKAINMIGYDADNTAADAKAYENLPGCCKKGGHDGNSQD